MKTLFMKSGAGLSDCGRYRYWLKRVWDESLPEVAFIMLNPSTADADQDDPTIRRCLGFARSWGCGGLHVVNLFALRATNPNALHDADDPVGPDNNTYILAAALPGRRVVAAWGVMGTYRNREAKVVQLLTGYPVECLGVTKYGRPKHPLYVPAATPLMPFVALKEPL